MKRRLVWLFAWEIFFPYVGPSPVSSHLRAIVLSPNTVIVVYILKKSTNLEIFSPPIKPNSSRMITSPETRILDAQTPEALSAAIATASVLLRGGDLVAFPTETVYGLGADAFNPEAIRRLFLAKGRPSDNPLIVHLASVDDISRCAEVDARSHKVAEAFMPGPITLVLASLESVPLIARAGLPTVALRVPDHVVAGALLRGAGPLVAPSANISGRPSPTTAQHVYTDLAGRIAAVIDGGACRVGIESTVLDLTVTPGVVLRPGLITPEELSELLGEEIRSGGDVSTARSPGMRHRHYAPRARVLLIAPDEPTLLGDFDRTGEEEEMVLPDDTLVVTTPRHRSRFPGRDVRDLRAEDLYAIFREADERGLSTVLVYAAADELPAGLLDRVRRAAER